MMATGIILKLSDANRNSWSDCSIRVSRHDCFIRVISVLIIDAQVMAMLLKVILVNFNELISFEDNSDYYDYNYDNDDVFHFELAGRRYCFYCLQQ